MTEGLAGLPAELRVRVPAWVPAGAEEPGVELGLAMFPDFVHLSLQPFSSAGRIAGLLMEDRSTRVRIRMGEGMEIPGPLNPQWLFFGYVCSRCGECFLVPEWVRGGRYEEDLPRAVLHGCMAAGEPSREEWLRQAWKRVAREVAATATERLLVRDVLSRKSPYVAEVAQVIAVTAEQAIGQARTELGRMEREEWRRG